jgi:hypothetical protein
MPLVRMLTSYATAAHNWDEGELVQASTAEAASWVPAGIAELVTEQRETPERDARREIRRGPGRPRTRR